MASAEDVSASYYAGQARIAKAVTVAAVAEWRTIDGRRLDFSWLRVLARLLAWLTGAQRQAASTAPAYLTGVLRAQGVVPSPGHRLLPDPFGGIAADGRGLDTLLYTPVASAKHAMSQGATIQDALRGAEAGLAMLVRTQVQDAGRMAVQTAMADDSAVRGYIRQVHLPACARCIILAGRVYRYSSGFQRHPNCDCTMVADAGELGTEDPAELIAKMRKDYPDGPHAIAKSLTAGDLEALDHGADLNQVVNAHRGMATAAGKATTEGTTRHGLAGMRLRGQPRMTPALIFAQAASENWTRQQIVAQLLRAGYII